MLPYTIGGGLIGAGHYMFYYKWWTKDSSWSPLYDKITGFGIEGTLLASLLIHPGLYWAGAMAGAGLGFFSYFAYQGNLWQNSSTKGFEIELPGLTPEEREKQKNKDIIHWMSLNEGLNRKVQINL